MSKTGKHRDAAERLGSSIKDLKDARDVLSSDAVFESYDGDTVYRVQSDILQIIQRLERILKKQLAGAFKSP